MYVVTDLCYTWLWVMIVKDDKNALLSNKCADSSHPLESKKKKMAYDIAYAKAHLKRIPLDMQTKDYETVKAAADKAGEKVNAYIKKAIVQRIERDKEDSGDT